MVQAFFFVLPVAIAQGALNARTRRYEAWLGVVTSPDVGGVCGWRYCADGYRCRESARYGKRVEATTVHHVWPAEDYPEYAWELWNLISLSESSMMPCTTGAPAG